jgi:hypothetical protein
MVEYNSVACCVALMKLRSIFVNFNWLDHWMVVCIEPLFWPPIRKLGWNEIDFYDFDCCITWQAQHFGHSSAGKHFLAFLGDCLLFQVSPLALSVFMLCESGWRFQVARFHFWIQVLLTVEYNMYLLLGADEVSWDWRQLVTSVHHEGDGVTLLSGTL